METNYSSELCCIWWHSDSDSSDDVVVSTSAWHAGDLSSIPGPGMLYFMYKNLALNIRDCLYLKVSFGCPLVSMPGEVKYPAQGVNV